MAVSVLALASVGFVSFAFASQLHDTRPVLSAAAILPPVAAVASVQGSPVRLTIPKIAVDATIDYVGLTAGGVLDAPKGPSTVAWYDASPRPGQPGNAVIDGHSGWVNNTPAIFDHLDKLQAGDSIFVADDHQVTTTFIVRSLRTYSPSDATTAVFAASDNKAHLNLITCDGVWSEVQQSFSERLVVFADKQ